MIVPLRFDEVLYFYLSERKLMLLALSSSVPPGSISGLLLFNILKGHFLRNRNFVGYADNDTPYTHSDFIKDC